jgi:hypothetical protein
MSTDRRRSGPRHEVFTRLPDKFRKPCNAKRGADREQGRPGGRTRFLEGRCSTRRATCTVPTLRSGRVFRIDAKERVDAGRSQYDCEAQRAQDSATTTSSVITDYKNRPDDPRLLRTADRYGRCCTTARTSASRVVNDLFFAAAARCTSTTRASPGLARSHRAACTPVALGPPRRAAHQRAQPQRRAAVQRRQGAVRRGDARQLRVARAADGRRHGLEGGPVLHFLRPERPRRARDGRGRAA